MRAGLPGKEVRLDHEAVKPKRSVKELMQAVLVEAGLANASEDEQISHLTSLRLPAKRSELTDAEKAYLEAADKAPKREYQQKGRI